MKFLKIEKFELVKWLDDHLNDSKTVASTWGRYFEYIAHATVSEGGTFLRKSVWETGEEMVGPLVLEKLELKKFETAQVLKMIKTDQELKKAKGGSKGLYCRPRSSTFPSVDAVILPGIFVQYFKRCKGGNHGFKMKGLQDLDDTLGLDQYEVCSFVPMEKFADTKHQNWLTVGGIKHTFRTEAEKNR